MRRFRYAYRNRSPRRRTAQQFVQAKRAVIRKPYQLGYLPWKRHLRAIYEKSPALYSVWRSATYSRVPTRPRHPLRGQIERQRDTELHTTARALLASDHAPFSNHGFLWTYVCRSLQLPVRWGWSDGAERVYRMAQLARALDAPSAETAYARVIEYLRGIGWTRHELALWLGENVADVLRARAGCDAIHGWLLAHYDTLLNLPTTGTVAYFGDPRLWRGFFPFQQNYAYRRMEYELLHRYQRHTVDGGMRPTRSLTLWVDRLRYYPSYREQLWDNQRNPTDGVDQSSVNSMGSARSAP